MPINGEMTLDVQGVQKEHPKGKGVESALASAYKSLGKEIKSEYPYQPKPKKMSYGSKGEAFNT